MEIPRTEPFLEYFERIPSEHLEWSPRPGAFTFGDLSEERIAWT